MPHERRRDVRVRVHLEAERVFRGRTEPVEILEASYRGVLLRTESRAPLNELMKLTVNLPTGKVTLYAIPVRETVFRRAVAIGCKLFALDGADKKEWQAFVATQLPQNARAA